MEKVVNDAKAKGLQEVPPADQQGDTKVAESGGGDSDRVAGVQPAAQAGSATPQLPLAINPENLRLSQNFAAQLGVKKAVITVPVRKPNRQEFVRTHPNPEFWLETCVLEFKEDRETYLVAPHLWGDLVGELIPKVLVPTQNRQGVLTLWPIRLPGEDGKHDEWNASALEAAQMAKTRWLRTASNMSLGAYDVYEAEGDLPEPEWPDLSLSAIVNIAFKGRWIDSLDHPAIRRLRGGV